MNRHDERHVTDAEVLAFIESKVRQEIAEAELLAALADCPHLTLCETAGECNRRHLDCGCVEAHEQASECGPWLREHSDGRE